MALTKFILGNILARTTGLKVPPYWLFNQTPVTEADSSGYSELMKLSEEELTEQVRSNALGVPMRMPLEIKREGDSEYWLLPFEPLITITGKNIITKRQVSKGKIRGSIKERWTQDDYQIQIQGILINTKEKAYPSDDVQKLRKYCEAAKWEVRCPLFEIFSIFQIVVEDFKFPFTSGLINQAYDLSCSSDDTYKLLLKKKDLQ